MANKPQDGNDSIDKLLVSDPEDQPEPPAPVKNNRCWNLIQRKEWTLRDIIKKYSDLNDWICDCNNCKHFVIM